MKKRKCPALLLTLLLLLGLCACGTGNTAGDYGRSEEQSAASSSQNGGAGNGETAGTNGENSGADGSAGTNSGAGGGGTAAGAGNSKTAESAGSLTWLISNSGNFYRFCSTEDGFYYLTSEETELADGSYGYHLMYMDYASCREVYLCSDSSCQHNAKDCTAVFADVSNDGRIFVWDGYLYYLDRSYDMSGSVFTFFGDSDAVSVEANQAALYRMNLDGSGRERIYSFEAGATVEEIAIGEKQGLYFITKKSGASENSGGTYVTTTDRKVICLDPENKTAETVCSLDFGDGLGWDVIGCGDGALVLKTYQYPNGMTDEDIAALDDDSYMAALRNSQIVYAALELATGEKTPLYAQPGSGAAGEVVLNGCLYASNDASEDIVEVDLCTGETGVLASLSGNYLYGTLGDMLLCTTYDMIDDYGYYFVDSATGKSAYCGLTNQALGWRLDFMAMSGDRALAVYDYAYTDNGDGSYEIDRYQYGLTDLESLLAGTAAFTPIQMVGKGE